MHDFRAMGTEVTVTAETDEAAVARAVAGTFAAAEQRFSRFRPDSELSALNRATGPVTVSAPLFDALVRARAHVERTGGLFDPAIGAALVAAGYDRPFAPGALDRAWTATWCSPAGSFLDVVLEPATRTVVRPPHVQLDLGGMIKGATVDAAAGHLRGAGAIDAGGDLMVRGAGPDDGVWLVDVEDPSCADRTLATLAVRDAAVATSAANRRRWRVGGTLAHHLIDPRTQRPAVTDLLQVTVVAPSAERAEVLAKATFLLGCRAGRRFLEAQAGVGALLVCRLHGVERAGDLDARELAA